MLKSEITENAQKDIGRIEKYLLLKWNEQVLLDFLIRLRDALDILESGNIHFERYEDTNFRKFLLTKHNSIIYKVENETVYIVRILQNFQNPDDNYGSVSKL